MNSARTSRWFTAAVVATTVISGCAPDTGDANNFDVTARIVTIGERSVTVDHVTVTEANGDAADWFSGRHQIHDNYNTCQRTRRVTVGTVMSPAGAGRLDNLDVGQTIRILGQIRKSATDCGGIFDDDDTDSYAKRPVFDVIEHGYGSEHRP